MCKLKYDENRRKDISDFTQKVEALLLIIWSQSYIEKGQKMFRNICSKSFLKSRRYVTKEFKNHAIAIAKV